MLNEISSLVKGSPGITIFDARPKTSATGNRVRGGGYEDERYYKNMNLVFCGINNIHKVRSSHSSLQQMFLFPEVFEDMDRYGLEVQMTGWMQLMGDILNGVNLVLDTILV